MKRIFLCYLAAVAWMPGCVSKDTSEPPRPGTGIAEYRKITAEAEQAMQAAIDALAQVAAESHPCRPEVVSRLSEEVNRLQVESIQVRARAQAIQARGDAYFDRWHENMALVKDPNVRALAESRRPLLQEGFQRIKGLSQQARAAFTPFLANLREVRNALERDAASVDANSTRERIRTAMENGKGVQESLTGIIRELDSMGAMVTPPAGAVEAGKG